MWLVLLLGVLRFARWLAPSRQPGDQRARALKNTRPILPQHHLNPHPHTNTNQTPNHNQDFVPPLGKGALYLRPLLMGSGPILGLGPAPAYTFAIYAAAVGSYFKVCDCYWLFVGCCVVV